MKKIIAMLLLVAIASFVLVGCAPELNYDSEDILYNDIVYERYPNLDYNLDLTEEHSTYIGDFIEIYAYGQELPWEVHILNDEANVLFSAHCNWLKPGYVFPKEFGEEFTSVEYVIPDGLDFDIIPDSYSEEAFLLATFDKSVKLEDMIEIEPTNDVEEFAEHNSLRFVYKNHSDIVLWLDICSADGNYYLNVRQGTAGTTELHLIKPEYVELLTSKISVAE